MSFSDERQKRLAVLQTRMAAANIDAALLVELLEAKQNVVASALAQLDLSKEEI